MYQGWKYLYLKILTYFHSVIVENTQAQLYNLSNCKRVFSTLTILLYIRFVNTNVLFLTEYAEPILVLSEMENDSNFPIWTGPFITIYSIVFLTVSYDVRFSLES